MATTRKDAPKVRRSQDENAAERIRSPRTEQKHEGVKATAR